MLKFLESHKKEYFTKDVVIIIIKNVELKKASNDANDRGSNILRSKK